MTNQPTNHQLQSPINARDTGAGGYSVAGYRDQILGSLKRRHAELLNINRQLNLALERIIAEQDESLSLV
ncbi:MAG: hypothetical protein EOP49_37085 [Sphingobacteriales bacterium]|nr:MAG: hypothetical protein EOP49_37085 [Sphingobacteriales bacterium]